MQTNFCLPLFGTENLVHSLLEVSLKREISVNSTHLATPPSGNSIFGTRGLINSGNLLTMLVYLSSRGASGMSWSAGTVEVTVVSVDVVDSSEGSSAETEFEGRVVTLEVQKNVKQTCLMQF